MSQNVSALKEEKRVRTLVAEVKEKDPHILLIGETKCHCIAQLSLLILLLNAIGYEVYPTFRNMKYDKFVGGGTFTAIKTYLQHRVLHTHEKEYEQLIFRVKHGRRLHVISHVYIKPRKTIRVYERLLVDTVKLFLSEPEKAVFHFYGDFNCSGSEFYGCPLQVRHIKGIRERKTDCTNKTIALMVRSVFALLNFGSFLPTTLDVAFVTSKKVTVREAKLSTDCPQKQHVSWNINVSSNEKVINLRIKIDLVHEPKF